MKIYNEYTLLQAIRKLNPGVASYDDSFTIIVDDDPVDICVIDGCDDYLSNLTLPQGFRLNRARRTIENKITGVNILIFKGPI